MKQAQTYSRFFDSWKDITEKNGIAAASDHSRIKDLDRGILLIETDHPGWKQILQTKQSKLLNDFRIRFPELDISGISLMLGNNDLKSHGETDNDSSDSNLKNDNPKDKLPVSTAAGEELSSTEEQEHDFAAQSAVTGLDAIQDEEFKETLKNLGQSIAERKKKNQPV